MRRARDHRSVVHELKRLHAAFREAQDRALRPSEVSAPELAALSALKAGATSGAELARAASVKPQSITPLLKSLEAKGLIVRRAPEFGRVMPTELTELGRERLLAGEAALKQVEDRLLSRLDLVDRARLAGMLNEARLGLEG